MIRGPLLVLLVLTILYVITVTVHHPSITMVYEGKGYKVLDVESARDILSKYYEKPSWVQKIGFPLGVVGASVKQTATSTAFPYVEVQYNPQVPKTYVEKDYSLPNFQFRNVFEKDIFWVDGKRVYAGTYGEIKVFDDNLEPVKNISTKNPSFIVVPDKYIIYVDTSSNIKVCTVEGVCTKYSIKGHVLDFRYDVRKNKLYVLSRKGDLEVVVPLKTYVVIPKVPYKHRGYLYLYKIDPEKGIEKVLVFPYRYFVVWYFDGDTHILAIGLEYSKYKVYVIRDMVVVDVFDVNGYIKNQWYFGSRNPYVFVVYYKVRSRETCLLVRDTKKNVVVSVLCGMGLKEVPHAVLFYGTKAMVVTFRTTDPLYYIDLSDPKNPKILYELKIPGYSEYIYPVREDMFVGIGVEADPQTGRVLGLKVSLFKVQDGKVLEISRVNRTDVYWSEALYTHLAFQYLPKYDVILLPIPKGVWIIGGVRKGNLFDKGTIRVEDWYIRRVLYMRNYLYLLGLSYIYKVDMSTGKVVKGVKIWEAPYPIGVLP